MLAALVKPVMNDGTQGISITDAILHFWFGKEIDDLIVAREKKALWWSKNPELDEQVRKQFANTLEAEMRGELSHLSKPQALLARIILQDQFPRNMYRGSAEMFAYDGGARTLCTQLLAGRQDRLLRPIERIFVYLPLEHAEDAAAQALCVSLFDELCASVPEPLQDMIKGYRSFAQKHKDIIDRFSRFPHRNALLGRVSTTEELLFLTQPGSSF